MLLFIYFFPQVYGIMEIHKERVKKHMFTVQSAATNKGVIINCAKDMSGLLLDSV